MQGKLLNNGQVTAQQTQINTASLPPATYFINVVNQENKKVRSLKLNETVFLLKTTSRISPELELFIFRLTCGLVRIELKSHRSEE